MGIFGNKPTEGVLFETSYMGFWIRVYPNRVEFKVGVGSESVPLSQVASVHTPMMGVMKITLETTGGKKYNIPTSKKKEVQQAIYDAQTHLNNTPSNSTSMADEISKLNDLKEKGILTNEEFEQKKKQLLGL